MVNTALWVLAATAVSRDHASGGAEAITQLLLSGGYVAGCVYRCLLPVIDIPRFVLVDSRLSSVLVGRSVATVAELCFAAQWALLLHDLAGTGHYPFAHTVSFAIVPLILLAEASSWYAVLTTRQRAHAIENSLWGLSAALAVAGILVVGPQRLGPFYPMMIAGGVAYVAFIFVYDVPMYWSRWLVDQASGRRYLRIGEGAADVRKRWAVSYRWEDWRDEVLWMSLYFTFGVWSSIWLVYASLRSRLVF